MRRCSTLLLLLLACGWGGDDAVGSPVITQPAPRAPRSMDGATLARWLADPSEDVRVVNFWASWCEPCIAEMPVLKELARRHRDVSVVLVDVDHPSVQGTKVASLRRNLGIEHLDTVLLDAKDPNADLRKHVRGWPEQIPWTLVLARDGTIVASFTSSLGGPEVDAALQRAAARR